MDGNEYFLTPKTKRSIRKVTVPESLHKEVLDFIGSMQLNPDERIFYFKKGGLYSEFKQMIKRSGNEDIRVHDLRHSHVAMLVNMGKPIEEISRRLGHESIKTTWDTYSHLYPGSDKELAKDIELLMQEDGAEQEKEISVLETRHAVPGCPLGNASLGILSAAESHGNGYVRRNNRDLFLRYGIDIEKDLIYGYKLGTYLDWIAFGDATVRIISSFKPTESLRDFLLAMFSDAISSCELQNGSLKDLDAFLMGTTIPKYEKIYRISGK